MKLKQLLSYIDKVNTDIEIDRVSVVKDGKAFYLSNMKRIDKKLTPYIPKKDGFYRLSPSTCGGICSIGVPKENCVKTGIYDKRKCSIYSFYDVSEISLCIKDVLKIINEIEEHQSLSPS